MVSRTHLHVKQTVLLVNDTELRASGNFSEELFSMDGEGRGKKVFGTARHAQALGSDYAPNRSKAAFK